MTKTANSGTYTLVYSAKDGLWHSSQTSPPAQVPALSVTGVSTSTVNLSWGVPAAGSYPINGYNIYRNGVADGFVPVPKTTDQDSGLSSPVTYTYNVAAVDTAGQVGPQSSSVTATTLFYTSPPAGALTGGTTGILYSAQITANGGIAPVTAAITAQSGNTYTISTTGQVATLACANPTIVGTDSVTVQFTDTMNNNTVPVTYTIAIAQAAAGFGKYDGTIRVSKNAQGQGILVNGGGAQIQPRGGNMCALQFVSTSTGKGIIQGNPYPYGGPGSGNNNDFGTAPFLWTAYAAWKPNIVRIPLNEASWLGLTNCWQPGQLNYGQGTFDAAVNTGTYAATNTWGLTGSAASPVAHAAGPFNADPYGTYRQSVIDSVAQAQAIGCYVILDLHCSAMTTTINGVQNVLVTDASQHMFMTDHSLAFWQSIAGVFGTQATPPTSSYGTIKNTAILFELFNEPFADTVGVYTAGHSNAYDLMLNGGTPLSDPQPYQVASCPAVNYGGQKGVPTYRTQTVNVYGPGAIPNPITGFQPVMNAIRGIGAANVCLIGSSGFSGNVCQFKSWFPTDPIAGTPQLGAVWHTYGTNFPFTGGAAIGFGNGASDGTSGTTNAFVPVATGATTSPIANGYPVINTEFAGYSNPWLYATPDPLSTWFLGQFDKYGMGGTLFQFNLPQPGGSFTGSLTAGGVLTVTANPQNILFTTGYQHPIFGPGLPAPTAANTFGTWVSSIANGPPVVLTLSNSSVTAASGTYYLGYANNSFSDAGFGLLGGFGATQSQLIPAYGDKATIFNWMTTHA